MEVKVIGAGLAGCEAAWQLAKRGISVGLYEMKPQKMSPAHHSQDFAELVCSNSLRGDRLENAVGLLKEELRRCDSLIMQCAEATRVEAGGCLAVDRKGFSQLITEKIRSNPLITVVSEEVTQVPEGPVIIATGPLTSDALSKAIGEYFGTDYLHFFDAAAPLVTAESVDMGLAWWQSRYDRGTPDYVNCAMDKQQYEAFVKELISAEEAEVHGFEDKRVFEGCMPVEVMARRGLDTLRYGPMKPVGLTDPKTGAEPYAVLQLRQDNAAKQRLQSGGLPDPPEVWGAEAGILHDPGAAQCGIRPLRRHAPEYLPAKPQAAGPILCRQAQPAGCLCRADDRRGGVCGVHRLRLFGCRFHGRQGPGKRACGFPQDHGHWGPGTVHQRRLY